MRKNIYTTEEIYEKGIELNKLHKAYQDAEQSRDKKSKWRVFYDAAQTYRSEFQAYMSSNPGDISDIL